MAKLGVGMIGSIILTVILFVLAVTALADTAQDVGDAADNITSHSDVYPLTSFFKKKGVVLLAFMAGIAITVIKAVLPSGK